MQAQEITYHAKLVAKHIDGLGYINYIFEDLEFQDYDYKYFMCVRFPNWENVSFDVDDIGYVTVKYVREGIDKWYDGEKLITYKYTNIIFLKFVHEKEKTDISTIRLD
jgi:hypothetical protein